VSFIERRMDGKSRRRKKAARRECHIVAKIGRRRGVELRGETRFAKVINRREGSPDDLKGNIEKGFLSRGLRIYGIVPPEARGKIPSRKRSRMDQELFLYNGKNLRSGEKGHLMTLFGISGFGKSRRLLKENQALLLESRRSR